MICEMCKYKHDIGNSRETGAALCTRSSSYFPINYNDNCHFIPQKRELVCSDCARFGEDFACIEAKADSKAYINEKICAGFIDAKKEQFEMILMFWKVQGMYDRSKIEKIIDEIENFYNDIEEQGD